MSTTKRKKGVANGAEKAGARTSTTTSLNIADDVYTRALNYKTSLRRTSKLHMGQIVTAALDEYLKRQGF